MAARKRKHARQPIAITPSVVVLAQPKRVLYPIAAAISAIVILIGCFVGMAYSKQSRRIVVRKPIIQTLNLPSFGELVTMTDKQISQHDLAFLNLRAAEGLPGAEDLNIGIKLAQLDRWALRVRSETDANIYRFLAKKAEYNNSEAYYRMLMLVTVLQQDFGVHYNEKRITDVDFSNSQDLFIHGMIGSENGGTCVSMPVLYTSIARRLGYPVYLVNAKEHLFCRWDEPNERFNIEGSSRGMNSYEDEHYFHWPREIEQSEVASGMYLKSLTVSESFAGFLASRGHCFEDIGNRPEASISYSLARRYAPKNPVYVYFLQRLVRPKTIEDFPELLAQQERLQKQLNAQHYGNDFGLTPPFADPFRNLPQESQTNPTHDPFANIEPSFYPYGVQR